ncbi:hypothetical protein MPSEU_000586000 [Mayamaea pseudoterrestris]|nr:hypothetical protein MPSEU_000586000 [Mayamaea pseudoterrestris]
MDLLGGYDSDSSSTEVDDNDNKLSEKPRRRRGKVTLMSEADADFTMIRNQPHVRGNWAGHVYLQASALNSIRDAVLHDLQTQLQQAGYSGSLLVHQDLHVSLHRQSFYLQLASIECFVQSLQERFQHECAATVCTPLTANLLQLRNESNTRVFYAVALQASHALERFHSHVANILERYHPMQLQHSSKTKEGEPFLFHASIASLPIQTSHSNVEANAPPTVSVSVPRAMFRVESIFVRFGTTKHYEICLKE